MQILGKFDLLFIDYNFILYFSRLSETLTEENTEKSRFAGSIAYMAPEKLLNQKFDSKVDLWSVGIIMYECLVGRTPFIRTNLKFIFEFISQRKQINVLCAKYLFLCYVKLTVF